MERARLGQSDLEVSTLVFGSMGRTRQAESERRRVLDAAIDSGLTSIDTAPLYDFGDVERFLGDALGGRRDRVELLSKVGLRWDEDHGEVLFATPERVVRRDSRPTAIRRDVEESLTRLRTDHLDLCQIHHPDRRVPIEEALGELTRLRDEGKIRHIGVSNVAATELASCIAFLGARGDALTSLQLHYSLLERSADLKLLPSCLAAGVGTLAYTPLEAGALSSRILDDEAGTRARGEHDPVFREPNLGRIRAALADAVKPVARERSASPSAICLAWVLGQPGVTAAIVGASSEAQLAENTASWGIALSPDELAAIGDRFATIVLDRDLDATLGMKIRRRLGRLRERLTRIVAKGAE